MKNIRHIVFDWGDTLMRDNPQESGPMCDWEHIELIPYAAETLQQLQGTFHLTVATNAGVSDTAMMRKALQRAGIEHYFSDYFSSKDLGVSKPDPAFFKQVCRQAGFKPEESLMIGNDYQKDMVGAHMAGMKTILLNHIQAEGPFPYADVVIECLSELKIR